MPLPFANLSMIICALIIVIGTPLRWLYQWYSHKKHLPIAARRRYFISLAIITSILFLLTLEVRLLMHHAEPAATHFAAVTQLFPAPTCASTRDARDTTAPKVILRLDDVQHGWHSDISMDMMNTAHSYDLPIVAGVIPVELEQDFGLVAFLRERSCQTEIAIHGFTHQPVYYDGQSYGEFKFLEYEQAHHKLYRSNRKLSRLLDAQATTLIPPQNHISDAARSAAYDHGINIVSVYDGGYFDADTSQWDYSQSFVPANTIIDDCIATFTNGDDLCVIMLHPQDLVDEAGQVVPARAFEYEKLLAYLAASEWHVTTFNALP